MLYSRYNYFTWRNFFYAKGINFQFTVVYWLHIISDLTARSEGVRHVIFCIVSQMVLIPLSVGNDSFSEQFHRSEKKKYFSMALFFLSAIAMIGLMSIKLFFFYIRWFFIALVTTYFVHHLRVHSIDNK